MVINTVLGEKKGKALLVKTLAFSQKALRIAAEVNFLSFFWLLWKHFDDVTNI